jgi:hypothetical protein
MQLYRNAQSHQRLAKQSKIASQRQYRVKEGDGFQELRQVIRSVTGETPQTRSETLKKGMFVLICGLLCMSVYSLHSCRTAPAVDERTRSNFQA